MTKVQKALNYLQNNEYVTAQQLMAVTGCQSPLDIIYRIRGRGYTVTNEKVTNGVDSYTRYRLAGQEAF